MAAWCVAIASFYVPSGPFQISTHMTRQATDLNARFDFWRLFLGNSACMTPSFVTLRLDLKRTLSLLRLHLHLFLYMYKYIAYILATLERE